MEITHLRNDERLRGMAWPSLLAVDIPTMGQNDCFVMCAGFEDRSISALRALQEIGKLKQSVVVIDYRPRYFQNRIEEVSEICTAASVPMHTCVYDRADPAGIGAEIVRFTESADRVVVDVSGMSRLLIVQTIVALMGGGCRRVRVVYTEAMTYPPSEVQFASDCSNRMGDVTTSYLSTGIIEVASTPELGSVAMFGESIRLIAFPSFDPSHLGNLVNELQPTYCDLIHGLPHMRKDRWRMKAIAEKNAVAIRGLQNLDQHESSTLDYRETLEILLGVYGERSMFDRFVVSPTGSKMQALAVGLFRAALPDIQVVYPTPMTFTAPDEHTVGARQIYVVDIPNEFYEHVGI